VVFRSRLGRLACAVLLASLPVAASAAAQRAEPPVPRASPGASQPPRISTSGNYLAARHAGLQRDAEAAAGFYQGALRNDPRNPELLSRAFLSLVVAGEVDEAAKLAEQVLKVDRNDRIAQLVLGVRALKQKHYVTARTRIAQSVRGPITDLTATLLTGWAHAGAKQPRDAVQVIDRLAGPDWYAIFKHLHAGLILDSAGQRKSAGARLESAYKLDASALRVVEAYGGWLSRNGGMERALELYQTFDAALPRHPMIQQDLGILRAGKPLPMLVTTPQAGAAEALYGLGAALGRRGGEDLGLIYLQLALYLVPEHPLALLSLADLYEAMKKPDLAIKTYEQIPESSPLRRNALIQLALNYDTLEKTDQAIKSLEKLIAERPDDLEAIMALGNVQRSRKQFAECGVTYGKALEAIGTPTRNNWPVLYSRGICFERAKQWPQAEADLRKALELFPDQPQVLNYLGYSWIDQGVNLDEGMAMIRRAVEQRPDDGYIVDSLGWAYYRLGNYEEAVKHLERAVELRPEDPTINDHLGDVYWRVGRQLEARFQWAHARDLKPEPDDLVKIEDKLRNGIKDAATAPAAEAEKPAGANGG